jgi:hypothetical protein
VKGKGGSAKKMMARNERRPSKGFGALKERKHKKLSRFNEPKRIIP